MKILTKIRINILHNAVSIWSNWIVLTYICSLRANANWNPFYNDEIHLDNYCGQNRFSYYSSMITIWWHTTNIYVTTEYKYTPFSIPVKTKHLEPKTNQLTFPLDLPILFEPDAITEKNNKSRHTWKVYWDKSRCHTMTQTSTMWYSTGSEKMY